MKLTLGQIADWMHAEGDFADDAVAQGYSIDSRTIGAGELFFAVTGERLDGHDYVEAALANGALAAVVSQRLGEKQGRGADINEDRVARLEQRRSGAGDGPFFPGGLR